VTYDGEAVGEITSATVSELSGRGRDCAVHCCTMKNTRRLLGVAATVRG
jgi:hypothetical protein